MKTLFIMMTMLFALSALVYGVLDTTGTSEDVRKDIQAHADLEKAVDMARLQHEDATAATRGEVTRQIIAQATLETNLQAVSNKAATGRRTTFKEEMQDILDYATQEARIGR